LDRSIGLLGASLFGETNLFVAVIWTEAAGFGAAAATLAPTAADGRSAREGRAASATMAFACAVVAAPALAVLDVKGPSDGPDASRPAIFATLPAPACVARSCALSLLATSARRGASAVCVGADAGAGAGCAAE